MEGEGVAVCSGGSVAVRVAELEAAGLSPDWQAPALTARTSTNIKEQAEEIFVMVVGPSTRPNSYCTKLRL
jgi:hypothetical protein